jgi:anti-sigma factor RsiW
MNCKTVEELLSDLVDDELSAYVRARVEGHIAGCESCTRSYRALRRTVRFVRTNAAGPFRAGSAGAGYADFHRAMLDPEMGRDPVEVAIEGFGLTEEE